MTKKKEGPRKPQSNRGPSLVGQRFGRLVVVSEAEKDPPWNYQRRWNCVCDCGRPSVARQNHLKRGGHISCGCARGFHTGHGATAGSTRGKRPTPEYNSWGGMRTRCNNPNNIRYEDYGGRGITVCERWDRFENFLADMGPRPGPGYSIDRIDNDGNYEPFNCRWADRVVQANNKRTYIRLTYNGKTQSVSEWAREFGMSRETIRYRLARGWAVDDIFKDVL